jgi:starch-binding outer membrane protein, SusD/RagB family
MNIFIAKRRVLTKFLIGFSLLSLISCQNEFLEMKPDKALLIPKTLTDLQSLLDNTNIMNQGTYFGLLSADEIYIPDNVLQSNASVRNIYTWADEVYEQSFLAPDWVRPYQQVFYTNIVLEALDNFENEHGIDSESSALRGSALFYRAFAFYGLSQVFAAPFVDGSADTELGVPILLK